MAHPCQGNQYIAHQREAGDVNLRNPKEKNHAGGYVYKISDMQRFERFLVIGTEGGTFYVMEDKLDIQNILCLDRIIAAGDGKKAIRLIEDVSINRRNAKQTSLLKALSVCARCNDKEIKKAAYKLLPKVCRIPTFLFEFIAICQSDNNGGKGWGRAMKKAITEWYRSFKDNPLKLARLVTKFKQRNGWAHKDVLRMAHCKIDDYEEIGFILRYIVKGHDLAQQMYLPEFRMDDAPPSLQQVSTLLNALDTALECRDEDQMVSMIREYKLTWEQCPTQMLRRPAIWKALLPHMPIEAMVKNLGRMTKIGLFAENSEEEETVLKKLGSVNKMTNFQPQDTETMETDEEMHVDKRIGVNFYHPFKLLIGLVAYKAGRGEKGKLTWTPNERIVEALDQAFYKSFEYVVPTGKKFYLAVDVSGSMSQPVMGSSTITCAIGAAAMMMLTVKTEENTVIKGFSHVMRDINIRRDDKLDIVMRKVDSIMMGGTDCALPMMDAMECKIRDVDVFVVYTDNETWYGKVHPEEALRQYRIWSDRKEAKLVVCGMCATEFTIANKDDPNMLDVVGFDSGAPRVISMFASGKMYKSDLSV